MTASVQDNDSVESFEMDIMSEESEDDEEEQLFVKNGKKSYDNGSAKKPLIKGSKKNGRRKRGIHTEIRTGNPAAKRCCGPVCCVILGIKTVMGLAAITIILTNYFTHSDWLFWNFGLGSGETEIVGCDELEVTPVWQVKFPKLITEGSTRMLNVNNDGVLDVVLGFGTGADGYNIPEFVCDIYFEGQKPCLGGLLALDGKDGHELWRLWTDHEIFSLTCQADLDLDNVTDCLAGGRAGVFLAVSIKTGNKIWEFGDHAIKSDLMSVYAAQFVQDLDGDGVQDVLAVHGGDPLSDPAHRNMYGRIILFSGTDGRLLRWMATPDRRESYYPPQVMTGPDGGQIVIYGTGGNMNSGALYAISLLDLYRKNINMTKLIYRDYAKGILSPALLMDVTGDGLEDIVIATINSNVMAFDGANYNCIWNKTMAGFESITGLTPAMYDKDDVPDVMVKYNYGDRFPIYQYQQTSVLCGKNGSVLTTLPLDTLPSLSSPLTLGVTGHGNDMYLHWTSNCVGKPGQQMAMYGFRDGTHVHEQSRADLCRAIYNTGTLSRLVAVSSKPSTSLQEIYNSSYWSRYEHEGAVNTSWQADKFLAKHPEIQQSLEENDEDDEYSVLPYKNKNFGNALKLLEQEMAKEYGDGQPFIDPGSQAYEAFDYDGQPDNQSNDVGQDVQEEQQLSPSQQQQVVNYPMMTGGAGGYPHQIPLGYQYQPQVPTYGQVQQYPPPMVPQQIQPQFGNKQRRKRAVSNGNIIPGLNRQTGTGTLAPSLILSNDTVDIIFPVHWIYPPKIDVLRKDDIECIKNRLLKRRDFSDISEDSEEYTALKGEIEEECLKASGHFAREDAVYETPSDYDPLSINMGQLIVYRFMLRCKCQSSRLGYSQSCATIRPYQDQSWPAYMGMMGDSIYRRITSR